jgi:hypothetical protein
MTKIALTAAAILVATSGAFASSDNFVPQNLNRQSPAAPVASDVDHSITGSIGTSADRNVYKTAPQGVETDSGHTIRGL